MFTMRPQVSALRLKRHIHVGACRNVYCVRNVSANSTTSRICAIPFSRDFAQLQARDLEGKQTRCISCTPWMPTASESIPSRRRVLFELRTTKPANQVFFTRSKLARSPSQRIQLDSVPTTNTRGIGSRLRKGGSVKRLQGDRAD